MPALEAGVKAPEIELNDLDGHKFSLAEARRKGPVVLAFFKISCPVCQSTFPYLERLFKAYGKNVKVSIVGISQDNVADTKLFNRQFGITFPVLLDVPKRWPASNAYGLTNVPSVFLVSAEGEIELSSVGWSKADIEELGRRLADSSKVSAVPIFSANEKVPAYKPG